MSYLSYEFQSIRVQPKVSKGTIFPSRLGSQGLRISLHGMNCHLKSISSCSKRPYCICNGQSTRLYSYSNRTQRRLQEIEHSTLRSLLMSQLYLRFTLVRSQAHSLPNSTLLKGQSVYRLRSKLIQPNIFPDWIDSIFLIVEHHLLQGFLSRPPFVRKFACWHQ